jgi:RNA polymerase sigma factor (sigma-70 family)
MVGTSAAATFGERQPGCTYLAEQDPLNRLLQQTGQGDRDAFAQLYRRTSPKLFGVCLRLLRDRNDAEEVLQEIYVTVWRRAASFDASRAGAISWLIALSRNKAIDRLRQHRRTVLVFEDLDDTADDKETPATADSERTDEYRRLQRCLEQLDPQHQQSLREAFFSGATYSELAARSKVPLGTMKSWIRRSLLQLRKCLEQ